MLSSYRTESLEANREQEDSPGGLEARMETADSPGGFEDESPQTAVTTGMITTKDHKYIELDLQREAVTH
jgi:hypothetical protein